MKRKIFRHLSAEGCLKIRPVDLAGTHEVSALNKPDFGLWASPVLPSGLSAWEEWCRYEMPSWLASHPHVYDLKVDMGKILVLTRGIWRELGAKYGVAPRYPINGDVIDWARAARDLHAKGICGVYLPEETLEAFRFWPGVLNTGLWDVPSLVIWDPACVISMAGR